MATNTNVVCRSGIGQARWLAKRPAASDVLILVFLQAGHEDDDLLRDRATLADVLAVGANLECTAPNYVRGVVPEGTTETYDTTLNRADVDIPDTTFTTLGAMTGTNSLQAIRSMLVCYDGATGSGSDADILVLTKHFHEFIADGRTHTVPFPNGFYRGVG
jgi:hypothetical protein